MHISRLASREITFLCSLGWYPDCWLHQERWEEATVKAFYGEKIFSGGFHIPEDSVGKVTGIGHRRSSRWAMVGFVCANFSDSTRGFSLALSWQCRTAVALGLWSVLSSNGLELVCERPQSGLGLVGRTFNYCPAEYMRTTLRHVLWSRRRPLWSLRSGRARRRKRQCTTARWPCRQARAKDVAPWPGIRGTKHRRKYVYICM